MKLIGFSVTIKKKKVYILVNPEYIQLIEQCTDNDDCCIIQMANGRTLLVEGYNEALIVRRIEEAS